MASKISIERLRELLMYNSELGAMTLVDGKPLKSWNNGSGYRKIFVDGIYLYYHRVLWAFIHGEWPKYIDHIDGDRENNSPANLRSVSNIENGRNCSLSKANSSGHTGVFLHSDKKSWRAVIFVNYKPIYLGYFTDKEAAISARKQAEIKHGFHPNHGRKAA